ncbi:hypothetical protein L1987_18853 [Smallanthus sonchifolius]|uniref:Uncharacterized protein n=1 Tax=Smallanthus sonchifolius TaxID=185202 RepID=A0ACB9J2E1_9ASTR|nr:hypothetical protein L1987_18853 [Smallanthus sonchifolius]
MLKLQRLGIARKRKESLAIYENQCWWKHLEYPLQLRNWENFNGDFCSLVSSPQVRIKCEENSISVLKIMGDKLSKVKSHAMTLMLAVRFMTNAWRKKGKPHIQFVVEQAKFLDFKLVSAAKGRGIWTLNPV